MSKFKNYLSIIVLLIILVELSLTSCRVQDKSTAEANTLEILFNDKESFSFNSYFDNPVFIPLETNKENLFRNINDLKIKDKKLFVFSMAPDNMISIYDTNGRYLNKINKKGRGPGEISFATSFDVDTHVTILDRQTKKLLNYDLKGNFVSETRLSNFFNSFSFLNKDLFVLHNYNSPSGNNNDNHIGFSKLTIWERSLTKTVEPQYITKDLNQDKHITILLKNYFSIKQEELYYWDVYNDSIMIFDYKNNKNELYQRLEFGKYHIPKEEFNRVFQKGIPVSQWRRTFEKGYATIDDFNIFSSNKHLFIIRKYLDLYLGIGSNNAIGINCYSNLCIDNIHQNLVLNLNPKSIAIIHCNNNTVYFEWKAKNFVETFIKLKEQLTKQEWMQILKSHPTLQNAIEEVTSEDNPILMKLQLKK